eukprot:1159381-Pelagomonas_calceolata.AAC.11
MPFLGENLLRPKLQQRVCEKSVGNIASDGLLRGPLMLVGFGPRGEVHKSREIQPGPDRPPPCLLFVLADAWGCQQKLLMTRTAKLGAREELLGFVKSLEQKI